MISKPVGSDPHLINNKLWAGTQNVVSEPIGFTPRGYYLFNLGSNPDFKIVTVGFKPTLILGLNVFTCVLDKCNLICPTKLSHFTYLSSLPQILYRK